jgi:hypothetical protein
MEPEDSHVLSMQEMWLRHTLCLSEETPQHDRRGERSQLRAFRSCWSADPASRWCRIVEVP